MYAVGVYIGCETIVAGLVDDAGGILRRRGVPTKLGRADMIAADIAALCEDVAGSVGGMSDVVSVGIGSQGVVNPKRGVIEVAYNLGIEDLDLCAALEPYFPTPVYVENDANCIAFGESISGASRDYDHSVTVTLSTGIGCGIIIHRRIYRGAFYGAGEVGHAAIVAGGELCSCGRKGCFEAYSSTAAIIRDTKRLFAAEPDDGVAKLIGGDINKITEQTMFDAAEAGDEGAKALLNRYYDYLAEGLANIAVSFQPHIIVLGGDLSRRGDALVEPLKERVQALSIASCKRVKLAAAQLGSDAGIVGAAMLTGC